MKQKDLMAGMQVETKEKVLATVVHVSYCHPYQRLTCIRYIDGREELVSPSTLRERQP